MFERFTDRARRVIVLAMEEARMLNHHYVGTEHILLGLIHEGDGVGGTAVKSAGISLEAARERVRELVGEGQSAPPRHIPFSPSAKKVLEDSAHEALQMSDNYIATEHILLGLVGNNDEGFHDHVATQVLNDLGANLNQMRQLAIQLAHPQRQPQSRSLIERLTEHARRVVVLARRH